MTSKLLYSIVLSVLLFSSCARSKINDVYKTETITTTMKNNSENYETYERSYNKEGQLLSMKIWLRGLPHESSNYEYNEDGTGKMTTVTLNFEPKEYRIEWNSEKREEYAVDDEGKEYLRFGEYYDPKKNITLTKFQVLNTVLIDSFFYTTNKVITKGYIEEDKASLKWRYTKEKIIDNNGNSQKEISTNSSEVNITTFQYTSLDTQKGWTKRDVLIHNRVYQIETKEVFINDK